MQLTKKVLSILCIAFAPLAAANAQSARNSPFLYVWSDPGSSSSRYSNVAPDWYRTPIQSTEGAEILGPRVKVYYGAMLVDDTALLPDERRALVPAAPAAKGRETTKAKAF